MPPLSDSDWHPRHCCSNQAIFQAHVCLCLLQKYMWSPGFPPASGADTLSLGSDAGSQKKHFFPRRLILSLQILSSPRLLILLRQIFVFTQDSTRELLWISTRSVHRNGLSPAAALKLFKAKKAGSRRISPSVWKFCKHCNRLQPQRKQRSLQRSEYNEKFEREIWGSDGICRSRSDITEGLKPDLV